MDFNKHIILGLDKENDLITLELNFHDLNRGTKWENDHYYFSVHGFTQIKDNQTGEDEAREILEEREYWEDLGYLTQSKNFNNPVLGFIDFEALANHVINVDGWQMTNGEFYYFADYQEKEYYLNLQWIGQEDKKVFDKKEYNKLYINEEDFKFLSTLKEIKPDSEDLKKVKEIISKYQTEELKERVVKDMLIVKD